MSRGPLLYILLIAGPGAGLAAFAWRVVEHERRAALRALEGRVEAEAAALEERLARELEAELAACEESVRRARGAGTGADAPLVAFAFSPGGLRYTPAPNGGTEAPGAGELRAFTLSKEGGEHFEHVRGEPYRALDAYTFYLPRIRSGALRARLRFHAARAARRAGRPELGRAVDRELFADRSDARTGAGFPIDVLAGLRLLDDEDPADKTLRDAVAERLAGRRRALRTPVLAALVARGAVPSRRGAFELAERRRLEELVRAYRDRAGSPRAILEGGDLLYAATLGDGPSTPSPEGARQDPSRASRPGPAPRRAFHLVRDAFPAWPGASPPGEGRAAAGFHTRRLDGPGEAPRADRRLVEVRTAPGEAPLARFEVRDLEHAARRAAIEQRAGLAEGLVIGMVLVTAGAGVFLARSLRRERRLARLRAQLVANVSHELRTPVTSIRMFSELLAREPYDPQRAHRFGELLAAESRRLGQLVENLLDLSRLRRKGLEITTRPVDVRRVLAQVAGAFRLRATEEGVDFEACGGAPGDAAAGGSEQASPRLLARAEPLALERILLNLLDNALKYGARKEPGSGARPRIELDAWREDGRVLVAVRDNGRGIARADRERVFDAFYRADFEEYAVGGAGLGLALSRRLARRMGGDLVLETRPGEGSCFTLHLLPVEAEGGENGDPGEHGRPRASPEARPEGEAPGADSSGAARGPAS